MARESMFASDDTVALGFLRDLAARQGGYERRSVRGWALREDVERLTGVSLPERLPYLVARGYLDRADVRPPSMTRPTWIYRITAAGAAHVPGKAPRIEPPGPPDETERAFYVPPSAADALAALCEAFAAETGPEHIPGERGWRSMRELRGPGSSGPAENTGYNPPPARDGLWEDGEGGPDKPAADEPWTDPARGWGLSEAELAGPGWDPLRGEMPGEEEPFSAFSAQDLMWLVKVGLAQRWVQEREGRGHLVLYRATPAGLAAVPLTWKDPAA